MLTPELQRQIRQIKLRARRLVDGRFAGDYLSIFKGRGTEFAEVREYEPGDDVRSIDWKVTARLGTPYVKQYIEERELTVMLLADVSASTGFSTSHSSKRQVIAEICTVLGLNAMRHHNRAGLLSFSDQIESYVEPGKGRYQTTRILTELFSTEPRRVATDLALALRTVGQRVTQRTLCFIVSDFHDEGYEKPLRALAQRHDVIPIWVGDNAEQSWPELGLMHIQDLESGEHTSFDSSDPQFREAYKKRYDETRASRQRIFRGISTSAIEVDTTRPFLGPLKQFFQRRAVGR